MLCCLLAALLAFAGVKGRRQPPVEAARVHEYDESTTVFAFMRSKLPGAARRPGPVAGFGLCCGALGFEVMAVLATSWHGLDTRRPELLLVGAAAVTAIGVVFAVIGGAPNCKRAWALFALAASAGSAVVELLDLHLLKLHTGEDVIATIALHGLAVLGGLIGGQILLSVNSSREARTFTTTPSRLRLRRASSES